MKLNIQYSEVINGRFSPSDLNLMLVFQVNCPGCFIHGFPLLNDLQACFEGKLSCFAMSTAFEDFELNTAENTRLLFEQNVFVGETLKAHQAGAFKWNKILFPVLVDKPIHQPDLSDSRTIETIIQHNEGWLAGPEPEKQKIRTALKGYFAQQIQCGYTFAVNLMQGTPTFILFDNTMSILLNWFGHQDPQLVTDKIDTFIKKS